jgi:hypothetical protein
LEEQEVFVGGSAGGNASVSGAAGLQHLEEGGAVDQSAVAQTGEESGVAAGQDQTLVASGVDDLSWKIDQLATNTDRTDCHRDSSAASQQGGTAGQDLPEACEKAGQVLVGQVAAIGGVAVVPLDDLPPPLSRPERMCPWVREPYGGEVSTRAACRCRAL